MKSPKDDNMDTKEQNMAVDDEAVKTTTEASSSTKAGNNVIDSDFPKLGLEDDDEFEDFPTEGKPLNSKILV